MKNLLTSDKARKIALLLLLAEMLVIFAFSAQVAEDSQSFSDKMGEILHAQQTIEDGELKYIGPFGIGIRKYGHFSEYALLGVLAYLSLKVRSPRAKRLLLAVLICAAYAVSDEVHQYFVPGRSCELRDILIDSSGALTGTAIMLGIETLLCRK